MTERDPNQPIDPPKPGASVDDTPTDTYKAPAWTPPPNGTIEEAPPVATTSQPVRTSGGGRLRWGMALLVTLVVVGIGAVAALLLTGQSAPSTVVGYAPADSIMYGELRLDLPGDQRQKLGQFLSKFPGFKDQANMPTKVDEVLDRIVLAITSNQQDFTTHIKPWFGGELGVSVSNLPLTANPDMKDTRFLVLVSVTDESKARAWLNGILKESVTTTTDYKGTQLVLVGEGSVKGAIGIHGKVMLLGDDTSVRAAVDTNGAGQLPKAARFAAALEALPGDSLGYFFFDMERYFEWIAAAAQSTPGGVGMEFDETFRNLVPEWLIMRLQARGDAIAFEVASPHVDSPVKLSNRAGELAPHLPPSTIMLVDGHEIGDSLLQTVQTYRTNAATAEAFKQIDQVAVLFGGFDGILGWMRDGGFALTRDGDKLDGGIVFSPKDRAGADRLLATLRSYATLGGGQVGLQVQVRDEPHAGTTISVIDLGDWRDIAALAGAGTSIPFEGHLEIAYAATDQIVVIGLGDSFVKAVLDAKPGASLADDARYKALIDRVGAQNVGSVYLDVTAVREMVESLFKTADPAGFASYETEIKPYLLPLDAYIQSSSIDNGLDHSVGMIVAK
jgi:Protein of unknown function (DUF3352)